ncbi:MAG: UbiA family prenyltransferase [Acidobacteriota bacterium]
MKRLRGYIRLVRFELPLSAGVCVVMGQMFALGTFASIPDTTLGFLSIFLLSASILVSNDYFDVETDRVNAPERPIPSGAVSPFGAFLFSILLLVTGLLVSLFLGKTTFAIAFLLALVGFLYNRKFKKSGLPGNLMVSLSVGMTFIYGGASVGMPFDKIAWFFGVIAGLIDLGEEIAADDMDVEGDRLIRSASLAIKRGRRYALAISASIFFLVILLTCIPFFLRWFEPVYIAPIALMDTAIAYSTVRLLQSRDAAGRVHIRRLYLGATAGLVLFLIMRLAGF